MSHAQQRETLAQALLEKTRAILAEGALDRDKLKRIESAVAELSGRTELWGKADFPEPDETEKQNRFLIAQDEDEGLTLYLNVMRPGKKIPPHNHTTWACIGPVQGSEINTLYERMDDGSEPGKATLKPSEVIDLKPGGSVSLMPNDIHSVEIKGTDAIRHLHFYGQPLETLSERLTFDLENGTCRIMEIGVKTKQ